MDIEPIDGSRLADLGRLLGANQTSSSCWCVWFIIPVKDYHAQGDAGNRAAFQRQLEASHIPMGLLAYDHGEPRGWCAVGPRARYVRALKMPTYRERSPGDDDSTWLLPCLFVYRDARGEALGERLVMAAAELARQHGATALESFPYAAGKRQNKETQVGFEPIFARCGFRPIACPSPVRLIMRLDL